MRGCGKSKGESTLAAIVMSEAPSDHIYLPCVQSQ